MRKLIFGMNVTLDGYIAAPGDDIGWGGPPSDELFQWWLDQERASSLSLYGRKLWETMSSYWPTGDQQPNATPAEIEFARNWRDTPKVVFSSTIDKVDWNTRLVTGDAVAEITRLKAEDGGPMSVGGATLAGAAMRAGLIDEYALATYPVLVGGGTPFFTALDSWVNLNLVETRTFPRRRGADQVPDEALTARPPSLSIASPPAASHQQAPQERGEGPVSAHPLREPTRQLSGSRRGFHPPAPTDPGVTISRHRALVILAARNRAPMPNGRRAGDVGG